MGAALYNIDEWLKARGLLKGPTEEQGRQQGSKRARWAAVAEGAHWQAAGPTPQPLERMPRPAEAAGTPVGGGPTAQPPRPPTAIPPTQQQQPPQPPQPREQQARPRQQRQQQEQPAAVKKAHNTQSGHVLPLLELPGEAIATIASHLPSTADRARLSATCPALLACSRAHSGAWWGGELRLMFKYSAVYTRDAYAPAASLTAWLAARRPALRGLHVHYPHNEGWDYEQRNRFWDSTEFLAPAVQLPSPPLPCLVDLSLVSQNVTDAGLAAILQHSTLTRLALHQTGATELNISLPHSGDGTDGNSGRAPVLPRLVSLHLGYDRQGSVDSILRLLSSPSQLTYLGTPGCFSLSLPAGLARMPGLLSLDVSSMADSSMYVLSKLDLGGLSSFSALTRLSLGNNRLTELPSQLTCLTALQRLVCRNNRQLAGGWAHLARLSHLTCLDLSYCGLKAVPLALADATSLRHLVLSGNAGLGSDSLLRLAERMPQLESVDLNDCPARVKDKLARAHSRLTGPVACSGAQGAGPAEAAQQGQQQAALAAVQQQDDAPLSAADLAWIEADVVQQEEEEELEMDAYTGWYG